MTGSDNGAGCASSTPFEYVALGSDPTAAALGNTELDEVARALTTDDTTAAGGGAGSITQTGDTVTYTHVFVTRDATPTIGLDDGEIVGETGLFDSAGLDAANMLARQALPLTTVVEGDLITSRWESNSSYTF